MTYFNSVSKHLVYFSVSLNLLAAIGIIAGSLYVMLSNWGPVDREFLVGPCITCLMYGVIIFGGSVLGHFGLKYQYRREGVFTHKFILGLHLMFQLSSIGVEVYAYVKARDVIESYKAVSASISSNPTPLYIVGETVQQPYASTEIYYANLFNNLFFGAANAYTAVESKYFWDWIGNKCPSGLSKTNCLKFFPYSHSNCAAEQNACYAEVTASSLACPYSQCRKPLLDYFVEQIALVNDSALVLIAFQCFVAALVMVLIFHNEYKIDYRRRSVVKRAAKPKTVGRKRKTAARDQADLLQAMAVVKGQKKFANVQKDTQFLDV